MPFRKRSCFHSRFFLEEGVGGQQNFYYFFALKSRRKEHYKSRLVERMLNESHEGSHFIMIINDLTMRHERNHLLRWCPDNWIWPFDVNSIKSLGTYSRIGVSRVTSHVGITWSLIFYCVFGRKANDVRIQSRARRVSRMFALVMSRSSADCRKHPKCFQGRASPSNFLGISICWTSKQ